jgi:membrane protein
MPHLRRLWEILCFIHRRFDETKAMEASGAIAYYAIMSLFPLVVFLLIASTSLLQKPELQTQIFEATEHYLPGSKSLIEGNIEHLISGRVTVGVLGTAMLLWSASLVFTGISSNVNQAWPNSQPRHFLAERMMALGMIGVILIILLTTLVASTAINLVPASVAETLQLSLRPWGLAPRLLVPLAPFLLMMGAFTLLYRWVPNTIVRWREAFCGAFFAATMMELTKVLFIGYLTSGLGSYQIVYGSLGALIAFMLWIYLTATLILLGAHLSAAIAHFFRHIYANGPAEGALPKIDLGPI